jgi:hypothetical protein
MEHAEYVYTSGMTEADMDQRLRAGEHGVLALADGDDSYAVPLSYHYDGERLLLRVSEHDGDGEKGRFIGATDTATFVCHEGSETESWSVQVRGPLREWRGDVDEATLNEWFPPFRLFDEAVERVDFTLWALEIETVVGRQTV